MSDIDFKTSRWPSDTSRAHKITIALRKAGEYVMSDLLRFGSLTLVLLGAALLVTGVVCRNSSGLPEWTGIVPVTAGMVILIFLTGRHS